MFLGAFKFAAAPMTGKNPGAIYVTEGGVYLGKIINGALVTYSDRKQAILDTVQNPLASAVAYGRVTGNCSCCGRELSDPASIEAGIGPVCASKYGF